MVSFISAGRQRLGAVSPDGQVIDLSGEDLGVWIGRAREAGSTPARLIAAALADALASGATPVGRLDEAEAVVDGPAGRFELAVPLVAPEVWAAGVTYVRSRDARQAETMDTTRDLYARVYEAERPELFLKDAAGRRTVSSGGTIRARSDSRWTVPEPELALLVDAAGAIVGYTAADDVSARDIEGANPLYLPQAKIYRGSCALGPAVLLTDEVPSPFAIRLRILDARRRVLFEGATSTDRMVRSFESLTAALVRDNVIDDGTVLSTGTGIVPPDDVTLRAGQRVEISIDGIGLLWNIVGSDEA
jgi:2-dehydro-3-deoxy-D-arabinonate dehydratase